jgi:hypothetical protein
VHRLRKDQKKSNILPLDKTTAMMTLMDTISSQWALKGTDE